MRLKEYIQSNESVDSVVEAYDGKNSLGSYRKGQLAVTPNRVVFVRKKVVSDISLNGVNSIEYRAPSYPYWYLWWAVGCLCLSALLGAGSHIGGPLGGILGLGTTVFLLSAGLTIVAGFFFRRAVLTLNTANTTFEFVSRNEGLEEIAHALRGREQS